MISRREPSATDDVRRRRRRRRQSPLPNSIAHMYGFIGNGCYRACELPSSQSTSCRLYLFHSLSFTVIMVSIATIAVKSSGSRRWIRRGSFRASTRNLNVTRLTVWNHASSLSVRRLFRRFSVIRGRSLAPASISRCERSKRRSRDVFHVVER